MMVKIGPPARPPFPEHEWRPKLIIPAGFFERFQWRIRRARSAWVIFKPSEYREGGQFMARLHAGPELLPQRFKITAVSLPMMRVSIPAHMTLKQPQPDRTDIEEIWLFTGSVDDRPPVAPFDGENWVLDRDYMAELCERVRESLPIWTIVRPTTSDYPGKWVARLHLHQPFPQTTNLMATADTKEALIAAVIPDGFVKIDRESDDDPVIEELWV